MDISVKNQELAGILSNVLVIGIFEDDKTLSSGAKRVDEALLGLISEQIIKKEGFKAKFGASVAVPTNLKISSDKIMLAGLGKKKEFDTSKLCELMSKLIKQLDKTLGAKNISCELIGHQEANFDAQKCAEAMSIGILAGMYDFDKYKTKKNIQQIKKIRIATEKTKDEKEANTGEKTNKILC